MSFVQVWFKVPGQSSGLVGMPGDQDEPIKRPCKGTESPLIIDTLGASSVDSHEVDALLEQLGVQNVQSTQPVVFIEDDAAWSALVAKATADAVSVAAVLKAAVAQYTGTPTPG